MPAHVVVGAQWGDEGKGKVVDLYTEFADVVVRYQGGNNAGHTLVVGRGDQQAKIVLHVIPSGILHADKLCVIAPGVVVDPRVCLAEIEALRERGHARDASQLAIAQDASVIMPYHRALDLAREGKASGHARIGTTGRGIGPCYEDRVGRRAVMMRDLLDDDRLQDKLDRDLEEKNLLLQFYGQAPLSKSQLFDEYRDFGERIAPYVCDARRVIRDQLARGRHVLFEGAQGTMLDVGLGTYPFVTSSHTTAGGVCVNTGVAPSGLDEVIGITKAYCTRVGRGPFPTEIEGGIGEHLQRVGQEFGSTTGRARRCGWLDVAALRYAARINGFTGIAVTKLDVLTGLETIKIAVGYRDAQGNTYDEPPLDAETLEGLEPEYEEMQGWTEDVGQVRQWEDLPRHAKRLLRRVETILEVPITLVSVGPERSETIVMRHLHRAS